MRRYQTPPALAPVTGAVITDTLEAIAREGARRTLEHALRAEADERLGRAGYERGPGFTGYRNGYARPREIGIESWSVPIRAPRLSDLPPEEPPFESAILPRRRYDISTQLDRGSPRPLRPSPSLPDMTEAARRQRVPVRYNWGAYVTGHWTDSGTHSRSATTPGSGEALT